MFILHLTGKVADVRQMEFEQTYLLASREIPKSCVAYSFYKDEDSEEKYHFITYWTDEDAFDSYQKTAGYMMVQQAFETLGEELTLETVEENIHPLKTLGFA